MWSSNQVTSPDIPWLADANTATQGAGNVYMSVGGAAFNPANPSQMILDRRHRRLEHDTAPTSGATDHASDLDRPNRRHRKSGRQSKSSCPRAETRCSPPGIGLSSTSPIPTPIPRLTARQFGQYRRRMVGRLRFVRPRVSSSASPTGGARRNRAIPPTAARPGRNSATEIPGGGSSFIGGTIAASTPQNIIWAPADSNQPYYTLNGGTTWNPITLPGVTQLERLRLGLLPRPAVGDRRPRAGQYVLSLLSRPRGVRNHEWRAKLDECPFRVYREQLIIRRLQFDAHVRPRRGRQPFLYRRTVGHAQLHAGK